jgi:hypothetical protein
VLARLLPLSPFSTWTGRSTLSPTYSVSISSPKPHESRLTHLAVFALPFPLLRVLKLKPRQLYGLIFTFGLGLITIAVNVSRFATIMLTNNNNAICKLRLSPLSTQTT